jgi:cysteine desulfurase
VSIQFANNEVGVIQPIKQIAEMSHKYGAVFHTDATQAFAHIPINVEELGVDMISASGHKISPVLRGIGFLYKKNSININPLIYGAQEQGLRGGTENTYGIIGLNKAMELCDVSHDKTVELCEKRDYFIGLLESEFGCKLNGHSKYRLPNNINVSFPQNVTGEALLHMLDVSDIKISVGSACNSQSIEPSYVLKAMDLSNFDAMRSVRFTLPNDITYNDIDFVIREINKCIKIIEVN